MTSLTRDEQTQAKMPRKTVEAQIIHEIEGTFLSYLAGSPELNTQKETELSQAQQGEESQQQAHRILLDVEKDSYQRIMAAKRLKAEEVRLAREYFHRRLDTNLAKHLVDVEQIIRDHFCIKRATMELLYVLSKPFPSHSEVQQAMKHTPEIKVRLMKLVRDKQFMRCVGLLPRRPYNISGALHYMGMELLQLIIPVMVFKTRVKMELPHEQLHGKRLWRQVLATGLAARYLLSRAHYRRPEEGMLLGLMVNLGLVACQRGFLYIHEQLKVELLAKCHAIGNKKLHDMLLTVPYNMLLYQRCLHEHPAHLGLGLSTALFQESFPHLQAAVQSELAGENPPLRNTLAVIVRQARCFAIYGQLRDAHLFPFEHLEVFLNHAKIDSQLFHDMLEKSLFRIDYSSLHLD